MGYDVIVKRKKTKQINKIPPHNRMCVSTRSFRMPIHTQTHLNVTCRTVKRQQQQTFARVSAKESQQHGHSTHRYNALIHSKKENKCVRACCFCVIDVRRCCCFCICFCCCCLLSIIAWHELVYNRGQNTLYVVVALAALHLFCLYVRIPFSKANVCDCVCV